MRDKSFLETIHGLPCNVYFISVSPREVRNKDFSLIRNVLRSADPFHLAITFDYKPSDPELWDIPQCREYIKRMYLDYPQLFPRVEPTDLLLFAKCIQPHGILEHDTLSDVFDTYLSRIELSEEHYEAFVDFFMSSCFQGFQK